MSIPCFRRPPVRLRVGRRSLAPSRAALIPLLLLALFTWPAQAQVPLPLSEAQRRAFEAQPLLDAQAAALQAAQARARAAGELPDPELRLGIEEVPVEGGERYSLRRDMDTMFAVGLMQSFPRGAKRRLRAERGRHEAALAAQALGTTRLALARDSALAWIDVWVEERRATLLAASVAEAQRQLQAAEIDYVAGRRAQAELLAARVSLARLQDALAGARQEALAARQRLSRWVGLDAAQRPLPEQLPEWPSPPPLEQLVAALRSHPHLDIEARRVDIAAAEVALAREAWRPDWALELSYAYRDLYTDMASVGVRIDLPLFPARRQAPELDARRAEQAQAEALREAVIREHEAELREHWMHWRELQARLRHFDAEILTASALRSSTAEASWGAGQGSLAATLEARQMQVEQQMARLELEGEAARRRLELMYFEGVTP